MLTGAAAIEALARESGKAEASRSSYWEGELSGIDVDAQTVLSGAGALGNFSLREGLLYTFGHWIFQTPFRHMARGWRDFPRLHRIGRLAARRQNRAFTLDMLRQVLTLACIRHHGVGGDPQTASLVIGDGYGVMASLLLLSEPGRKIIAVNLAVPLLADLTCISRAVPGVGIALARSPEDVDEALARPDISVIALRADDAAWAARAPLGLVINVVSMQEMNLAVIEAYFRLMRDNPALETVFYCCNKLSKELPDGTIVRFNDYPWRDGDVWLTDEICRWSQLYYTKKFPFWHYRHGADRVIWHRLAVLDKASGTK